MEPEEITRVLGAISQPTRYEIMQVLGKNAQMGGNGVTAGAISSALQIQPATLSFHLKDMTLKGVLSQRREGRNIVYSANLAVLISALEFVVEDICGG